MALKFQFWFGNASGYGNTKVGKKSATTKTRYEYTAVNVKRRLKSRELQ